MKRERNLDWITFDIHERRYALPVSSWLSPPAVPETSINEHRVVGEPVRYEPLYGSGAQEAFLEGFRQTGRPEDTEKYLRLFGFGGW